MDNCFYLVKFYKYIQIRIYMVVKVDQKKCIGCGACVSVCPKGFVMKGGKSQVKDPKADCIDEAIETCPVSAISR